jgi:hypothetical protein
VPGTHTGAPDRDDLRRPTLDIRLPLHPFSIQARFDGGPGLGQLQEDDLEQIHYGEAGDLGQALGGEQGLGAQLDLSNRS